MFSKSLERVTIYIDHLAVVPLGSTQMKWHVSAECYGGHVGYVCCELWIYHQESCPTSSHHLFHASQWEPTCRYHSFTFSASVVVSFQQFNHEGHFEAFMWALISGSIKWSFLRLMTVMNFSVVAERTLSSFPGVALKSFHIVFGIFCDCTSFSSLHCFQIDWFSCL